MGLGDKEAELQPSILQKEPRWSVVTCSRGSHSSLAGKWHAVTSQASGLPAEPPPARAALKVPVSVRWAPPLFSVGCDSMVRKPPKFSSIHFHTQK